MKAALYIIFGSLLLVACEKTESPNPDALTGIYINPQYSDSTISFQRANAVPENAYAIHFMTDGKVVERKNAGWCGTPPITYNNFDGSWSRENELVEFVVEFWGGTIDVKWEIMVLDKHTLKVKLVEQTEHMIE